MKKILISFFVVSLIFIFGFLSRNFFVENLDSHLRPSRLDKANGNDTGEYKNKSGDNSVTTQVKYVYDGDTFMIQNNEVVRLLSIDTPEKNQPCYKEAKNRLMELVLKKEIILEQGNTQKDKYDRMLAWVFMDNKNINLLLVEEGLARAFILSNEKYNQEIIQAEKWAKAEEVGCLWGR